MQQFTLHIKNRNWLIAKFGMIFNHIMALILFTAGIFFTDIWWKWGVLGVGIAVVVYFLYNYKALKQRYNFIDFLVMLFEVLILLVVTGIWWFAIFTIVHILLFIETRKGTKIKLDEEKVLLQGPFLKKQQGWQAFDNIVARDGLITLDYKNNKLVQLELDHTKSKLDEISFNEYCKKVLTHNKAQLITPTIKEAVNSSSLNTNNNTEENKSEDSFF
jgi:hypothetical protein